MELFTWLGILICITHSAMFSGLNLAVFSLSRLRLEVEAGDGNKAAQKVLQLREDPNRVLTTILWGNVGINVLLTLLSDSVLAGVSAFAFSTVVITLFGEIAPQAYFSRNAMKMASLLAPVLKFYQWVLFPVVKPSAWLLDIWLGKERIHFFRESQLKEIIRRHMEAEGTELDTVEAIGALNFLTIDDLPIVSEGVPVHPESIVKLPFTNGLPVFPDFTGLTDDPFLRKVNESGRRWVVIMDESDNPLLMLDADGFLRHMLFHEGTRNPYHFCHRPVIITDRQAPLAEAINLLQFDGDSHDDLIDNDIILVWGKEHRIITGADILGRLLRGVLKRRPNLKQDTQ
jgi:metal transporter CNNM